ncbi:MAG: hypothetical protein HFI28_03665 [Lachnospiraceae bacterium]|nr:hypothetical protein [Lachnospiraceae bacterium]
MNFFTVQSLNTYTKNMEMQMKWQKKKATGDFKADGAMTIADSVKQQAEEIRRANEDGTTKMSAQIELKLNSGQKLTAEEMAYLRDHDPQAYQRVKAMESEQKNYEQELKRCKTKEEVQRVRMAHAATSLSNVNEIKNNPNIPESKKLELVWNEHRKNMALQQSTQDFIESGKYAKLPTEAEKQKAEKELEEAKKAELGIEDPTKTDKPKEENEDSISGTEAPSEDIPNEKEVETEKAKAALTHREMTRQEAESTPEALKVKRAKARAAYHEAQTTTPDIPMPSQTKKA